MLSVGLLLRDRYRIDALPDSHLSVYRAFDTIDNRFCAVKEVEGDEAARLEREAGALATRRHPNLPVLYDYFTIESRLYAVLEFPEGESLAERVHRQGALPETDASHWIGQILSALDYIHALNLPLCRGGFTPAHVWIDGNNRATFYGNGITEAATISPDDRAGYLAPEESSGQRADVFSAGATLYHLLTARPPEQMSPRKSNRDVSHTTAQVVQRAMSPRPEARYSSIRDMRKALGRAKYRTDKVNIALGVPPRPAPSSALYWMSGLTVLLIVLTGMLISWSRAVIATTPTAPPTLAVVVLATHTATLPPTSQPSPSATVTPPPTASPTPNRTPQPGATAIAKEDGMTLVFIPGGEFIMGSLDNDELAFANEKPQHTAAVDSFWIDRTEVTNAQYQQCVASRVCAPPAVLESATRVDYYDNPQYADYPVIWVSWQQANAYCAWVNRRLPTEAEWEKAARGEDGRLYPWGNQPPDNTLLNFNLAAGDTTRVGSFPNGASPYGVLDMSGNIVEWVADFYYDSYFPLVANPVTPTPSFRGGVHALRSSSWNDLFANIRVASRRYSMSDTDSYNNVGFRCADDDVTFNP